MNGLKDWALVSSLGQLGFISLVGLIVLGPVVNTSSNKDQTCIFSKLEGLEL